VQMSKITYKAQRVNRPIIVNRGFPGKIDCNQTMQYFGEWVSFMLPMNEEETCFGELRLPLEQAIEQGLVMSDDSFFHTDED
jgi:hypothetical protein